MSDYYIEKAILATTYKIERVKRETGIFKRNKWTTILVGAVITIVAPNYTAPETNYIRHIPARNALEMSELTYVQFSIEIALCYTVAIVIAHFTWSSHDRRKIKRLEKHKAQLEQQLSNS
jgi:glucan phosphoethanolaminetransferase (alkaline phosphatase superfamily)